MDFLDYLTREIDRFYRVDRPIWDKRDNWEEKRRSLGNAMSRAKTLYDLSKMKFPEME